MSALPEPNPQTEAEQLESAVDQAIAACGGDLRATIRALILANEFLEASASKGFRRGVRNGLL
ncbi:MAG: hypothetical protein AB1582_12105 [Pseudomonadota bacterium]